MKFGIGQSAPRKEDARFLSGRGQYVEDIPAPDALHAVIVRSPEAHARIARIDASAARQRPGVTAVLTGADYRDDGLGGLGCHTLLPHMHRNRATKPVAAIALDRVLYVGAPVAVVIAESRSAARDAAEAIAVDYEALESAITVGQAAAEGAPILHEHAPENVAYTIEIGDAAATDAAFSKAAHVTEIAFHNNRVSANAMEMRGAMARYDSRDDRLTFYTSTQAPHAVRNDLAAALQLPPTAIRVIAPDVGGGFGMKGGIYPEDVLVAWAAWRLKRTIRWQAERSESLLTDYHGRDQMVRAALALDTDGRFLALRMRCDYNSGAYLSTGGGVPPMFACTLATGCYRIATAHVAARALHTNTSPTQPYRGAGRPEAAFLIERLVDKAARETGRDPVALRRANMIRASDMPYKTPLVYTIDSGDYGALLDRALALADWEGACERKAEADTRGRLRGIGIALHNENAGLANEAAEIRVDPAGGVTILAGTFNHGQGHETVYAQMVADWLGIPFEHVRLVQGDTDAIAFGRGTIASRSMINGGGALRHAADDVIEKGRAIAGHMLEAGPDDIAFEAGAFHIAGTDKSMPIAAVAAAAHAPNLPAHLSPGLTGSGAFAMQGFAFPAGCQIAEVEIDPDTGAIEVKSIVSADDVGTVLNPMLLEGQLVGGIVQGMGQIVLEDIVYDAESGQLLSGSFMDYAMPRADHIPPIRIETASTPSPTNPLGVKGAGEAGTVGAMPAIFLAITDALAAAGVNDIAMPATPERIWSALAQSPRGRDFR